MLRSLNGRMTRPPALPKSVEGSYRRCPAVEKVACNPRYDAELRSLDIDVYVDYGTVDDDYVAALEAISRRTGVPGMIFEGRLTHVPRLPTARCRARGRYARRATSG
jgi:hypothetical protein